MKTNLNNCFNAQRGPFVPEKCKRMPWNGNLDDAEMLKPGGLLLASLISHASANSIYLNEMASELGVSYGYINQLCNGIRSIDSISDDFAVSIARFMGIPRMTVLMLAGRVTPDDIFESEKLMANEISQAMSFIQLDMEWGHLLTTEILSADELSKFALIKLYEGATGKVLLNKALNLENLAEKVQDLKDVSARRKITIDAYIVKKSR
jgi:plasmid maintenance system antidote protein VapI